MSKAEMEAQLKDMLFRRANLNKEISAITMALRQQGEKLYELASRLRTAPETVKVDRDAILLCRKDGNDYSPVPTMQRTAMDAEKLSEMTEELRKKMAELRDTQAFLTSQGYPQE